MKALRIITLLTLLISSVSFAADHLNGIVAIVNNDVITNVELNKKYKLLTSRLENKDAIPPKNILMKQILDKLILDKLKLQKAVKYDISVSSKEINDAIQNIAKSEKITVQKLTEDLASKGVSFDTFRDYIKEELIITELQRRAIGMDISVSDNELESFINSPLGQDLTGTEYLIGHILLEFSENNSEKDFNQLEQKAKHLVAKLSSGADFNKIAMAESKGVSALEGGDLGWRTIGEIPSLFAHKITSMKIGEVVGPIKSPSGYHIIKLKEKRVGNENLHQEFHVRQILLKPGEKLSDKEAHDKLEKLYVKLKNGESFAKLAQQNTDELANANNGGDLGWISKDLVLPEFYNEIIKLEKQEISKPFKTKLGWHLVQVVDKRNNNDSLSAAKNKARSILLERKFSEKLELWHKNLKAEAKINNLLEENSNS